MEGIPTAVQVGWQTKEEDGTQMRYYKMRYDDNAQFVKQEGSDDIRWASDMKLVTGVNLIELLKDPDLVECDKEGVPVSVSLQKERLRDLANMVAGYASGIDSKFLTAIAKELLMISNAT